MNCDRFETRKGKRLSGYTSGLLARLCLVVKADGWADPVQGCLRVVLVLNLPGIGRSVTG